MRHSPPRWARPSERGRCVVCGQHLTESGSDTPERYWITAHPDGVHQRCRQWQLEPFPFANDLERLRFVAHAAIRAWRQIARDGHFLRRMQRGWPADAEPRAREWLERKQRLQHHLTRLRERFRF